MKAIIVIILLIIVGSLGSALFYLIKDRSPRTVRALTLRIRLSIALFLLLLLAYAFGIIKPHGLRNGMPVPESPTTPANPR